MLSEIKPVTKTAKPARSLVHDSRVLHAPRPTRLRVGQTVRLADGLPDGAEFTLAGIGSGNLGEWDDAVILVPRGTPLVRADRGQVEIVGHGHPPDNVAPYDTGPALALYRAGTEPTVPLVEMAGLLPPDGSA
jgi:hypothetical protein